MRSEQKNKARKEKIEIVCGGGKGGGGGGDKSVGKIGRTDRETERQRHRETLMYKRLRIQSPRQRDKTTKRAIDRHTVEGQM